MSVSLRSNSPAKRNASWSSTSGALNIRAVPTHSWFPTVPETAASRLERRVLRLDVDRAGKCCAPAQRRLRAAIDLDLLDVPKAARAASRPVDRLLDAVDIDGRQRRAAGHEAFRIYAANDEAGIVPVRVQHVGKTPECVAKGAQEAVGDLLVGHDADAGGRVVQRGGVLRAVDGDRSEVDWLRCFLRQAGGHATATAKARLLDRAQRS